MKPKTRLDNFLAKIAKDPEADSFMEPKTRKEYYLNEIAENGGSGSGYTVTEERVVVIPEQTVTDWEANPAPSGYAKWVDGTDVEPLPDELIVTFNGAKYSLEKKNFMGQDYYGATISLESGDHVVADWTEYPLVITCPEDKWTVFVETDGQTVTIKAEAVTKTVTPSEDFKAAVLAVVNNT